MTNSGESGSSPVIPRAVCGTAAGLAQLGGHAVEELRVVVGRAGQPVAQQEPGPADARERLAAFRPAELDTIARFLAFALDNQRRHADRLRRVD